MKKNKNNKGIDPIPEKFESIEAAAEFWDSHSLADYWDQTSEAHFDVELYEEPRSVDEKSQLNKTSN